MPLPDIVLRDKDGESVEKEVLGICRGPLFLRRMAHILNLQQQDCI